MSLPPRLSRIAKLGIVLAIGSVIPWLLLFALPFLPLSLTERAMGVAGLLVIAEVMFWVGAVLAGQEVVRRFRQTLNPRALWKMMVDRVPKFVGRDRALMSLICLKIVAQLLNIFRRQSR
jgi:hypothetical protein